jgi:hypothetical protein
VQPCCEVCYDQRLIHSIGCLSTRRHRQLLEMELDVLYSFIASPPVAAGFPVFVQRIINKELPHGADILLDIHGRFLKELRPLPSISTPPNPCPASSQSPLPEPPSANPHCSSFNPPVSNPPTLDPYPDPPLDHIDPPPIDPPPLHFPPPALSPPPSSFGDWGSMPATWGVSQRIIPCEDDSVYQEETGFAPPPKGKKGGAVGARKNRTSGRM